MKQWNIPVLIKVISELAEKNMNRMLKKNDVTATQNRALFIIREAGEPIPEKYLEEALHISQPSTVGLVRRMECKELVTTSQSPQDRRSILVGITPKGEEICRESYQDMKKGEALMERGLSEEEKQELKSLLFHVFENMASDEERGNDPE